MAEAQDHHAASTSASANLGPLLTSSVHEALLAARSAGAERVDCSLDLGRRASTVELSITGWSWQGRRFPFLETCRSRTIYHWDQTRFEPVARFGTSLVKLVPTSWGPPTFEIDGIKMLPTARVCPFADAGHKVSLIEPRGKRILDTCGGLGYCAAWCLRGLAAHVLSYESNADVLWLRSLNPWSPDHRGASAPTAALQLIRGDVTQEIVGLADESVDAILHDPPRFGIAGELYSQAFYGQLARVLKRRGRLFHYTGTPNRLTSGRDVPNEVAARLRRAGFTAQPLADGVLAIKARRS